MEGGRTESSFSAFLMLLCAIVFPVTRYLITTRVCEQVWLLRLKWDYFVHADALQLRSKSLLLFITSAIAVIACVVEE